MSWAQIIIILKLFKYFFACKNVLDANHHYPENTQNLFASKIVLDANHQYPGNIQRLFCLQNCLSRKSSLSWKCSKTFPPAKLSPAQIIIILKKFKNVFACKIVFDANHLYPENIHRLFRLQYCLGCKSSLSWKYSKTFSPPKFVLDENHHYPEIIQKFFRLQNCLRRKSSLSWKYSKTFRQQNCLRRKSSISWKYSRTFPPAKLS